MPSKVFLDEPYPTNLPVVFACRSCNEDFSLDEEYVACLVECSLTGLIEPDGIEREKIRLILERKPALVSRLCQARQEVGGGAYFNVEDRRVMNIVLKLARGHAAFELNEPQLDDPSNVAFVPFLYMAPDARKDFETPPRSPFCPEVGSRATQRLVVNDLGASLWITVQSARYRYLTSIGNGVIVRMVIGEYLACEVVWNYV